MEDMPQTAEHALPGALDRETEVASLILAAMRQSEVATCLFRHDDTIAFTSAAFAKIMNVPADAKSFADIIEHCHATGIGVNVEGDVQGWLDRANIRRRSQENRVFETDMRDGRWFLVSETTLADGWLWVMFTDITFLKSTENMLRLARDVAQQHAETDDLTGLYNRRFAMSYLTRYTAESAKPSACVAIALVDIDFFKTINDRFGHDAGDEVLRHFARNASRTVGAAGTVCRIGGEEFLAILPGRTPEAAGQIIEELKASLGSVAYGSHEISYTFSAGIAGFAGGTQADLLRAADQALYAAKLAGRNRSRFA